MGKGVTPMLFFGSNESPAACAYIGPFEVACLTIGMSSLSPQKPSIAAA